MKISGLSSYNRAFAIFSGSAVGVSFILLSNLAGVNPLEYITVYNTNFLTQGLLSSVIISTLLLVLSIISAGIVTSFMMSKKNCIFGGFAGIFLITLTMLFAYGLGGISFPIFYELQSIMGFISIPFVFLVYAVPTVMIGFILGYLGSYLAENLHYFTITSTS